MRRHILVADGPSGELRELARKLAGRDPRWEVVCVESGRQALAMLGDRAFDALVMDLDLADQPGLELATRALADFPQMHRIVMTDLGDPGSLFRCIGGVHQLLTKPCEPERLGAVLDRAFAFQIWLPNQTVRSLVGRVPNLPSPGADYNAVVRELRIDPPSIERVASLVALDPPMSAKLLQLANSAAYGAPLDEADPVAAVRELGATNTQGALLLGHTFSEFAELADTGFDVDALWDHARRTGRFARQIAESQHATQRQAQQAATAGLLHDLGTIALAVNLPKAFGQAQELIRNRRLPVWEAEQEIFGATHAEVGACLLALWNLPPAIIEAVAMHHLPTRFLTQSFCPLTAVHIANAFDHSDTLEAARQRIDLSYLAELRLSHRLPEWWDRCQADRRILSTSHSSGAPSYG